MRAPFGWFIVLPNSVVRSTSNSTFNPNPTFNLKFLSAIYESDCCCRPL